MAKARYSMGPLSVGQLQYHSVMTPSCLVGVDESAPGHQEPDELAPADGAEKGEETSLSHTVFTVYRDSPSTVVYK